MRPGNTTCATGTAGDPAPRQQVTPCFSDAQATLYHGHVLNVLPAHDTEVLRRLGSQFSRSRASPRWSWARACSSIPGFLHMPHLGG